MTFSLVRTVTLFRPQDDLNPEDPRTPGYTYIDPDACTTSTSRKKLLEQNMEAGARGERLSHAGDPTTRGWWRGADPGETIEFTHSLPLPPRILTIARSRYIEVLYSAKISVVSALSSHVSVEVPVQVVDFLSLDPPPSQHVTTYAPFHPKHAATTGPSSVPTFPTPGWGGVSLRSGSDGPRCRSPVDPRTLANTDDADRIARVRSAESMAMPSPGEAVARSPGHAGTGSGSPVRQFRFPARPPAAVQPPGVTPASSSEPPDAPTAEARNASGSGTSGTGTGAGTKGQTGVTDAASGPTRRKGRHVGHQKSLDFIHSAIRSATARRVGTLPSSSYETSNAGQPAYPSDAATGVNSEPSGGDMGAGAKIMGLGIAIDDDQLSSASEVESRSVSPVRPEPTTSSGSTRGIPAAILAQRQARLAQKTQSQAQTNIPAAPNSQANPQSGAQLMPSLNLLTTGYFDPNEILDRLADAHGDPHGDPNARIAHAQGDKSIRLNDESIDEVDFVLERARDELPTAQGAGEDSQSEADTTVTTLPSGGVDPRSGLPPLVEADDSRDLSMTSSANTNADSSRVDDDDEGAGTENETQHGRASLPAFGLGQSLSLGTEATPHVGTADGHSASVQHSMSQHETSNGSPSDVGLTPRSHIWSPEKNGSEPFSPASSVSTPAHIEPLADQAGQGHRTDRHDFVSEDSMAPQTKLVHSSSPQPPSELGTSRSNESQPNAVQRPFAPAAQLPSQSPHFLEHREMVSIEQESNQKRHHFETNTQQKSYNSPSAVDQDSYHAGSTGSRHGRFSPPALSRNPSVDSASSGSTDRAHASTVGLLVPSVRSKVAALESRQAALRRFSQSHTVLPTSYGKGEVGSNQNYHPYEGDGEATPTRPAHHGNSGLVNQGAQPSSPSRSSSSCSSNYTFSESGTVPLRRRPSSRTASLASLFERPQSVQGVHSEQNGHNAQVGEQQFDRISSPSMMPMRGTHGRSAAGRPRASVLEPSSVYNVHVTPPAVRPLASPTPPPAGPDAQWKPQGTPVSKPPAQKSLTTGTTSGDSQGADLDRHKSTASKASSVSVYSVASAGETVHSFGAEDEYERQG